MSHPDTAYAWAAGIVDGEGHFGLYGGYPRLSVGQTDPEMLQRLQALFGGGVNGPYRRQPGWAPIWDWMLTGLYPVYGVFDLMRPWLGTVKTEQALKTLLASKVTARPGYCRRDLHLMSENAAPTEKRCRLCSNEQANRRYHEMKVAP